ncbi:MAG: NACHT domain-containing protein [Oscillatoria sp. SIO1A7]|nr:NACHT domain-containing protein [Oscillatoria sp. SIO1A7]
MPGVRHASIDQLFGLPEAAPIEAVKRIAALYLKTLKNSRKFWSIFPSRTDERTKRLIEQASEQCILEYQKRHNKLQILEMPKPVDLESIYTAVRVLPREQIHYFESIASIELAYRQSLRRSFEDRDCPRRSGIEVANKSQFLMVLGQPGGGKTTFLRKVGLEAMKLKAGEFRHSCLPVFIELKRLKGDKLDLKEAIIDQFRSSRFPQPEKFTDRALERGRLLLLLDGLDEVPADSQERVLSEIQSLANQHSKNRFIASCRTAAYRNNFGNFTEVVIAACDDDQIEEFIGNWFSSQADRQAGTAEKCWNLLNQPEYKAAKELAQTPLLLTFLCLVYDDSQGFPGGRAALYRKALGILLEKWAAQKRLDRDPIWQYFSPELEKEMLAELAYQMFQADRLFFSRQEAINLIQEFLASNLNSPQDLDGETVLNAIEVQQGILVERSRDIYSFSHLTLQEYLTAQYIVDNRQIEELVSQHLNEERWREVFLLVAGLAGRRDRDDLLLSMEKETRKYIVNLPKLRRLLQWADWITDGSEGDFKPLEKRAFALAIASDLAGILDFAGALALELAQALTGALTEARALDLTEALTEALDLDLEPVLDLVRALDLAFDLADAQTIALALVRELEELKVFRSVKWGRLTEKLQTLKNKVPRSKQHNEVRRAFARLIVQIWCKSIHLNRDLVELSIAEAEALRNYLLAIHLMVQCKETAVRLSPKTWAEIESRLLRVPED